MTTKRKKQAKLIRTFRKVHRTTGIFLFVFFFFVASSGIVLGWKKHSGDLISPKNYQGSSNDMSTWLPIDDLKKRADSVLLQHLASKNIFEIDRIDIRPNKGLVKFNYTEQFWSIQLDGATGELLHIGKRNSDFFESIHDGSILDNYFESRYGQIKLIYTNVMGLALLLFTVSGFWIWYGPKRMRKG